MLHAIQPDVPAAPESDADCTEPATDTSTRTARVQARVTASRLLGMAIAACSSQSAVARALGVSHQQVSRWCDPDHTHTISAAYQLALPPEVHRVFAASMLGQHHAPACSNEEPLAHVVHVASAAGRFAASVEEAIADGEISAEELTELQRTLARLDRAVDRARVGIAAGPVSVRRP